MRHSSPLHTPSQDPQSDLKLLKHEANLGLPVKGFKPTWEEGRPTSLEKADKGRGFLSYERKPLGYRCGKGGGGVSNGWLSAVPACVWGVGRLEGVKSTDISLCSQC